MLKQNKVCEVKLTKKGNIPGESRLPDARIPVHIFNMSICSFLCLKKSVHFYHWPHNEIF